MFLASDEAPFVFGAYATHLNSRPHHDQPVPLSPVAEVEQPPVLAEPDEPATPARLDA